MRDHAPIMGVKTIPAASGYVWLRRLGLVLALALWVMPGAPASAARGEALSSIRWQQLSSQRQGLTDDYVQAVAVAQGVAYIGTRRGLNIYSPAARTLHPVRRAEGLPHDNVRALLVFGGRLAIGTERGLALLALGKARVASKNVLARSLDIRSLTEDDGTLYLATSRGVYRYRPGDKNPKKIPGVSNQAVVSLATVQRGVLMTLADGSVRLLDRKTRAIVNIPVELNALRNPVIGAAAAGDWLWFATQGSGLIGYQFMREEWVSLSDQPKLGGYLTCLAADGQYLWFGSFSGLFRYDSEKRQGVATRLQDLTDKDLTCLAVDGQRIWVGTAGDGVFFGKKQTPFLSLRPFPRYVSAKTLEIPGRVQGRAPLRLQLEYRTPGARGRWIARHATIKRIGERFTGRINFRKLPDGKYACRLSVRDSARDVNTCRFLVVKETKSAEITFRFNTLRPGRNRISGEYAPATVQAIILTPGNVTATLDPDRQTYVAELDLSSQDRVIGFQVRDIGGRVKTFQYRIKVHKSPRLEVSAKPVIFVPGYEKVRFSPRAINLGDLAQWELHVSDQNGRAVYSHQAEDPLPKTFSWDGTRTDGRLVPTDRLFYYSFTVREKNGFSLSTPKKAIKSHRAPPAQQPRVAKKLERTFRFDTGEALIKNEDLDFFREIQRLAKKHPNSMLLLEGHTDSQPINTSDYKSNQELSEARAAQVAAHLRKKFALSGKRILTVGYGSHYPVARNDDPEERRKNRRVEITIVGR